MRTESGRAPATPRTRVTILGENHADPACRPAREAAFALGVAGDEFVALDGLKQSDAQNAAMLSRIFPGYSEQASRFRGLESAYPDLVSGTFISLHAFHGAFPSGEDPKYRASVLERILTPEGQRAWSRIPRPIGHPALEHAAQLIDGLAQREEPLTFDAHFYAVAEMPLPLAAWLTRAFAAGLLTDIQAQLDAGTAPPDLQALQHEGRLESLARSLAQPAEYEAYNETVERITFRYREESMAVNLERIVEEAAAEGKDVTVVTGQAHLETFARSLGSANVEVIEKPYQPQG